MSVNELFERAMAGVKATGKKMIDASHEEAIIFRLAAGMDEGGHPVKPVDIDEATGLVIPKKRGRPKKNKEVISKEYQKVVENFEKNYPVIDNVKKPIAPIKTKVVKTVKTKVVKEIKKSIKKKEKFVSKGRVSSVPSISFNNESLAVKSKMFDKAMVEYFGKDKYDGKTLIDGGKNITITKSISPKDAFVVVMATKTASVKFYEYIELKKLYMSKIVNYAKYLKPTR